MQPQPILHQMNAELYGNLVKITTKPVNSNRTSIGSAHDSIDGKPNAHSIDALICTTQPKIDPKKSQLNSEQPLVINQSLQQRHDDDEEDRWDKFIECMLFFCCVA